jgi:hypothetical protein
MHISPQTLEYILSSPYGPCHFSPVAIYHAQTLHQSHSPRTPRIPHPSQIPHTSPGRHCHALHCTALHCTNTVALQLRFCFSFSVSVSPCRTQSPRARYCISESLAFLAWAFGPIARNWKGRPDWTLTRPTDLGVIEAGHDSKNASGGDHDSSIG